MINIHFTLTKTLSKDSVKLCARKILALTINAVKIMLIFLMIFTFIKLLIIETI